MAAAGCGAVREAGGAERRDAVSRYPQPPRSPLASALPSPERRAPPAPARPPRRLAGDVVSGAAPAPRASQRPWGGGSGAVGRVFLAAGVIGAVTRLGVQRAELVSPSGCPGLGQAAPTGSSVRARSPVEGAEEGSGRGRSCWCEEEGGRTATEAGPPRSQGCVP